MKSKSMAVRRLLAAAAAGTLGLSSLNLTAAAQQPEAFSETQPSGFSDFASEKSSAPKDSEAGLSSSRDSESPKEETPAKEGGKETSRKEETDLAVPGDGSVYDWKQLEKDLSARLTQTNDPEEIRKIGDQLEEVRNILDSYAHTPMYRLYNPNTGEHFYTQSDTEKSGLIAKGWKDEGIGWYAPVNSGKDVYRLYNPIGDHHYTLDPAERDALVALGWRDEGVGWKSYDGAEVNAQPIYRQYNPNAHQCNHNYTSSQSEARTLIGYGWNDEKVGWYGLQPFKRVESAEGFRYYDGSTLEPLTGLQTIDGSVYYLDPLQNGLALSGPVQIDGNIYVFDEDGRRMSGGLVDFDGKTYLLDGPQGSALKGLQTLDSDLTGGPARVVYFLDDGSMAKNMEVDGMRFDQDGNKIGLSPEEQIRLDCLALYDEIGTDLRSCFDWTWSHIRYQAYSPQWITPPPGLTREENFALMGLEDQKGNCYVFASTMVYLARNLGYEARLARGTVQTSNGQEEHGWCEILQNGKWYICDGSFAQGFDPDICFMQPEDRPTFIYYRS